MGYSPWGHKELDTPEQLNTHKEVNIDTALRTVPGM